MLETAATMEEMETNLEYVRILRKLLDIHGRLRCAAGVAADFVKVRHFFVSALIYRPDDNRLGTVFRRVCLFVCQQDYWKTLTTVVMKLSVQIDNNCSAITS